MDEGQESVGRRARRGLRLGSSRGGFAQIVCIAWCLTFGHASCQSCLDGSWQLSMEHEAYDIETLGT